MSHQNGHSDEDARKLFVGGLAPGATSDDVKAHFSQYGEVQMSTVKTDMETGRSRGFAFLIFTDVSSVNQALSDPSGHTICGKAVDAKLATPQKPAGEQARSTKVFVGGLDGSVTKEDLQHILGQRGTVTDAFIPMDRATSQPKGFAFVTFSDANVVEELCSEGKVNINGKECDVKPAHNKNESRGGGRGGFRGGRGGGFGGRGGRGGYQSYDQGSYGGGGYDQGSYGSGGGYQGGYGGQNYGGYDQYGQSGGYAQTGYGK